MNRYFPELCETLRITAEEALREVKVPTTRHIYATRLFYVKEDKPYWAKYKEMRKYIKPLKRMMASLTGKDPVKVDQLKTVLEVLCNPSRRVSIEALTNYEPALDKISSYYSGPQFKKQKPPHLFLVSVARTLRTPIANHTLQITFRPHLKLPFGRKTIASLSHRTPSVDTLDQIPHILQREIANLDTRFKLTLDDSVPKGKTINLICHLDDTRLPCVPPLYIQIPECYPFASPICLLSECDYSTTSFFAAVRINFKFKFAKLPKLFSLTRILDAWEKSVCQACSPKSDAFIDFTVAFEMLRQS